MDHFSLPKGKGHIRIPNLTFKDYTSGLGDFHGYPAREGWSPEDIEGHNSFGGRTLASVQGFFQNWLFFGCAIEVLAITGVRVQPGDLLDESREYVCTRKLPFFIRQSRRSVVQLPNKNHPVHIEWAMKTARILKMVSDFVENYCIAYSGVAQGNIGASNTQATVLPLPEKVWLSVIALGHTLTEVMISHYDIRRTGNHWGASTLLRRRMLRKGWCPMDVERSLTDVGIDGHYYMAKSSNPDTTISHQRCTKNKCVAHNINEDTYQQRHVREKCDCGGMKLVDEALLSKIIDDHEIPVFYWDSTRKKLDMRSSHIIKRGLSDPAYVAISHVWSDGMGNPNENALHECQLHQIQEMVNTAAADNKLKGNPRYFWLDTLSVPARDDEEMKKRRLVCIRQMASIYKGASAVLVLSSTVRKIATTDSESERGLALYLANWNRRLWTFQEGMLAEKIILQFADKAVDHDKLHYPGIQRSIARGHCVTFPSRASGETMSEFVILRDILRDRLFEMQGPLYARMGPLAPAISAMQFRSTSKRSDETVCLGTLMRLKIKRLQDAEEEIREEYQKRGVRLRKVPDDELASRRMELFVSMVRVFPPDIIFNSHSRLVRDGFRWAPSSLLGIPRRGFVRHTEGGFATFNKERRGLLFRGPGIIINPLKDSNILPYPSTGDLLIRVPQDGHETLRLNVRPAQPTSQAGTHFWDPGTCYGFILRAPITQSIHDSSVSDRLNSVPTNGSELESWFESLYPRIDTTRFEVDVVVGTIQHGDTKDYSAPNSIEIRHECVGTLTVLNPSALVVYDNESEGADTWETEDEEDSESESDRDFDNPDDSINIDGIEGIELDFDNSDDSSDSSDVVFEDFDLAEDFEVGSDYSKASSPSENLEDDSASMENPVSDVLDDLPDDSVTEPDVDRIGAEDSESETSGSEFPLQSSDSGGVEANRGFVADVLGELKGKGTKWFIL